MFRRYPYWGWLLISLVLWCINGYQFRLHRQAMLPERMAHAVNKDLQSREDDFQVFLKDEDLVSRLFSDSLTEEESDHLNKESFYVFAYDGDSLKQWNTNTTIAEPTDSMNRKVAILHNDKGTYIAKYITPFPKDTAKRLVILFPVLITYPLENSYLKSHFAASDYIPITTKIISPDDRNGNAYPIILHGEQRLFSLVFNAQDIQKWIPDTMFIIFLLLALIASMSWIQLMIIYLTRNRSSMTGFAITLSLIVVIRIMLFYFGLPFNLDTITFFSPSLYASSKYLSSFGDLFIDTLCLLWLIVFLTRHTPYKTYCNKITNEKTRKIVTMVLVVALVAYVFLFVNVIRSLVLDSNISFNVGHWYTINVYTIFGLLVIGTITGMSCLVMYLVNTQLNTLVKSKMAKYLLVTVVGAVFLLLVCNFHDGFNWVLLGWITLFFILLDIPRLELVSNLFEPHMLFWAVFICLFGTVILQYFNEIKERSARIAFVEHSQVLFPHRDNMMEYDFYKAIEHIKQDKVIKGFFYKPSSTARKAINQRFDGLYLNGTLNKYRTKVYLFDRKTAGLYNKDTTDYTTLINEQQESDTFLSSNLYYKENIQEGHSYLSHIPIYSDSINRQIGYVIIVLEPKKQVAENVSNELLLPTTNSAGSEANEYAYAIYMDNKLVNQTTDYAFANHLLYDTLQEQKPVFFTNNNISELYYKTSEKRTIVVVNTRSQFLELLTLFSYLFGVQVLLAAFILIYQLYISYFTSSLGNVRFFRLTLRRRVHFSMLTIVLISFIIIGGVTIWYFTNQYRTSNSSKLQSSMMIAKQSVQDYLRRANVSSAEYFFDTLSKSPGFKGFITTIAIANGQKIDINIFDNDGELVTASQDDIYNKSLISRRIRPDAFFDLNYSGKSVVIQNEMIGGLSYLSGYEPLRDDKGETMGYINVPFFSSEKDLNYQISSIVITLINIYAFIFLLSSILAIFITRWITRTFNVVIEQFGRINLQRNERITWPYDDEIGLLVREYNKMVNKVEENAAKLAQSEREMAWREMARQVAHEIKNPLTPMKLNIQYLQQAMRSDKENIKELTEKVSASIIEQIDNLSYIASEFSNFAKMPEAREEELELNELLNTALELYLNDAHIKVTVQKTTDKIFVLSDRSQLLRVFTNLLENAKQAIPEDRQGNIEVSLTTENNEATIAIADNGSGISQEVAQRIFQPYFTTKSSGTGLGLAMTKKIIEFWKGVISFESEEGKGTTFFIRLPIVKK
ncbi:MAG: histidine kinase [Flavipsychrobacter sp.]|nr:histidine kinase [Flavipsychrobacter sp.]